LGLVDGLGMLCRVVEQAIGIDVQQDILLRATTEDADMTLLFPKLN